MKKQKTNKTFKFAVGTVVEVEAENLDEATKIVEEEGVGNLEIIPIN